MTLPRHPSARRASRGFSLVELMVASAVGLLVAIAVTTAVISSGRQYAIVSANVSAQSSAQVGLSLIDQAGRRAGAGFFANGQTVCPTWNAWNGTSVVADGAVFQPARIVAGANNKASDRLVFTGGSGAGALTATPVLASTSGASINVSNSGGIDANDLAVIGAPGKGQPCTLFQVSQAPTTVSSCGGNAPECQLLVRTPNTGLNPGPTAFASSPTYGFATSGTVYGPAVVSRIGSAADGLRQDAFAVQCNALVRYNAFTTAALPACTQAPLAFDSAVDAIATDIVMLRAQYGISSGASSDVVTNWVSAKDSPWDAPGVADVARIKAVRVVLVARSREADGQNVSAPCTNGGGVANTGPCSFEDASAPTIDLTDVPVPAGRSWRNYRYRVHTAVIPLRTVIWSDS